MSPTSMLIIRMMLGYTGLDPIELIAGSLSKRQGRLVEAWAELHQSELLKDWQLLQEGHKPLPIKPRA
ncbi:MAG: DUF4160 domain-containing protein [Methylococcales bacterium]